MSCSVIEQFYLFDSIRRTYKTVRSDFKTFYDGQIDPKPDPAVTLVVGINFSKKNAKNSRSFCKRCRVVICRLVLSVNVFDTHHYF